MKKLARTVTTALFAAALLGAAPFAVAHATTMEKIDAEVSEALTAENLSATFGLPIALSSADGRFAARASAVS